MVKKRYIKLDMDDIMEILIEHYQEQFEGCDYAKGILLGTIDRDLRFVSVYGAAEDDSISEIDLELLDKQLDYNGNHSFLKRNPEFCMGTKKTD